MTRHEAREIALHLIYGLGYGGTPEEALGDRLEDEAFTALAGEYSVYRETPRKDQEEYIREVVSGVSAHEAELDGYIEKYAIGWNFDRISRIGVAILRLAMYEVLYCPDIPVAAAINEAVELSKQYDSEVLAAFVNGVMGSFSRKELPEPTRS